MKLVIVLQPDGQVSVEGPLQNKMVCYEMLDCGRDAIQEWNEKNKGKIVVVPGLAVNPGNPLNGDAP